MPRDLHQQRAAALTRAARYSMEATAIFNAAPMCYANRVEAAQYREAANRARRKAASLAHRIAQQERDSDGAA